MNQSQAEEFVTSVFRDIWEGKNIAKFSDYYHQDIQTNLGGKSIDYKEIQCHAETMKKEWQNVKVDFHSIISDNHNKIAVHFTMSGIQNNTPVSFDMMGIYTLKDNKLYHIFGLSNPPMVYPDN